MTFFDSLKKWFYTRNSSAASSDARVPLLDASGNPKGSDTMANLASVLGGFKQGSTLDVSANTIFTNSVYYVYGDATKDTPTGYGVLVTTCSSYNGNYGPSVCQQFFDSGYGGYYTRVANSGTWGAWQSVPNFYKDYLTLASLASALGEQLHIKSAKVTPGQTIDISCGYGLFVASNLSNGGIAVFATGVSSVFYAVNSASHIDATISKVSEYVTRVTSNAGTVRIIYLQTESVD